MDSRRPLVAERYDAAMKITGITQLHSFAFYPNGIVEARQCYGANPIILQYPSELVEILEEEVPLAGSEPIGTSEEVESKEPKEVADDASMYRVDEWVAVVLEKNWYPGFIVKKSGTKLHIQLMTRNSFNQ